MATIPASFTNGLKLMASLSPTLLGFFMVMLSVLNQDAKGIVYLAGLTLALLINIPFQKLIGSPVNQTIRTCNLFGNGLLDSQGSPSTSSLVIAFTFAYLFLPMQFNNQMNYAVVTVLLLMFTLDAAVRIEVGCIPASGAALGAVIGAGLGALWYSIIQGAGGENMLYYNEVSSNSVKCSRPSKQTFRCKVYKKGSLTDA